MSSDSELGTLVVVVLKARNLRDKHSFYKQDAFAQVSLNGDTQKTNVDVKGGQHPTWDEELRFPIMKSDNDKFRTLQVSCYSKESREDDLLASGKVDISETLKTGEFDDWVPLQEPTGQQRGDLYLEMTYFANSPPPESKVLKVTETLQRRPSKLKPSERLAPPPAWLMPKRPEKGQKQSLTPPGGPINMTSRISSKNPTLERHENSLPPIPEPSQASNRPTSGSGKGPTADKPSQQLAPTSGARPQSQYPPESGTDGGLASSVPSGLAPGNKPAHVPSILRPGNAKLAPMPNHGGNQSRRTSQERVVPSGYESPPAAAAAPVEYNQSYTSPTPNPYDQHHSPSPPIPGSYRHSSYGATAEQHQYNGYANNDPSESAPMFPVAMLAAPSSSPPKAVSAPSTPLPYEYNSAYPQHQQNHNSYQQPQHQPSLPYQPQQPAYPQQPPHQSYLPPQAQHQPYPPTPAPQSHFQQPPFQQPPSTPQPTFQPPSAPHTPFQQPPPSHQSYPSQYSYQPPYNSAPPSSNNINSNLPDPYLIARYHSPLPLPPSANPVPSPQSQPPPMPMASPDSTKAASTQPSAQELAQARALEEAERRKQQEERDMELARQLDRELNIGQE